jgi:hypothetical protein
MEYKNFNRALKTYIRSLKKEFPHVCELAVIYRGFKIGKTLNKQLPQIGFSRFVGMPYGRYIEQKRDFFMDPDFVFKERILAFVHNAMKREWMTLDEKQKSHHWDVINNLLVLSSLCKSDTRDKNKRLDVISKHYGL